jgi:DNA-binding NarL/FixJ family response regulator
MPLLIVQAPAHLVRQPIVQSLSALGIAVREFTDLGEAVSRLNDLSPDLMVVDADGMARRWRTLAAGLGSVRGGIGLVLLASRFSFADAHDAQALRVAGVIMKPYRREEHAARLLEAVLARKGLRPRRLTPRVTLTEAEDAHLELSLPSGEEHLLVRDIAEGGIAVVASSPAAATALVEGEHFPSATLSWGALRRELSFEVVHASDGIAGLRFIRVLEGWPQLARILGERLARALGRIERKRRW